MKAITISRNVLKILLIQEVVTLVAIKRTMETRSLTTTTKTTKTTKTQRTPIIEKVDNTLNSHIFLKFLIF